jgi:hypothetical protein
MTGGIIVCRPIARRHTVPCRTACSHAAPRVEISSHCPGLHAQNMTECVYVLNLYIDTPSHLPARWVTPASRRSGSSRSTVRRASWHPPRLPWRSSSWRTLRG